MPLPPLPPLPAEWRAIVFTRPQTSSRQYDKDQDTTALPDIERLAFIGDAVLQLCVTEWLHENDPSSNSKSELIYQRDEIASEMPAQWEMRYKLSSQRFVKTSSSSNLQNTSTSKRDLFLAYVGAIYLARGGGHGGLGLAVTWIKSMLDFDEHEANDSQDVPSDEPDDKYGDELSGMLNDLLVPRFEVHKSKVVQVPSTSSLKVETPSSRNSLSILNEKATRKRAQLDWNDVESGPDHAKNWGTTLTVEGKEYGGVGHSKKGARYQAAENALKDLKWI